MKRSAWLLVGVLCSATLLFAADKPMNMTGTICDKSCVTKVSGLNTCDPGCTTKSGTAVFVGNKGKVMQIENQDMATSHMGKSGKMKATPSEAQRENTIRIMEFTENGP